ncbi:hypothetical protein ACA910_009135 [Epithemia clementina (nom. ined.)]
MAVRQRPAIAYSRLPGGASGIAGGGRSNLQNYRNKIVVVLCITILYTAFLFYRSPGGARSFLSGSSRKMQVTTFNIAAINNNPFEYWLTMPENPGYEELMSKIENFIENPGDKDVPVSQVFTPEMFGELEQRIKSVGWASVKSYWEEDFSKRNIVTQFLKDGTLGSKRLASMPDRVTNVISTTDGKSFYRPTVISMYEEDLNNQQMWWKAWQSFMFEKKFKVKDNEGRVEEKAPWEMLQKIKKSKYPAISEQEEKDSLPLQTLCGAVFDGILVHMMNTVSQPEAWQPLKRTIVENLNKKKVAHTLEILEAQYMDSDIIALQEVSNSLVDQARKRKLGGHYHIISPANADPVRDQNSVILLSKKRFPSGSKKEITDIVQSMFPEGKDIPVANGDILAILTKDIAGEDFVIASFHGDTNGLATIPVLDAIVTAMKKSESVPKKAKLLFGLDANTYESGETGKTQDVMEWSQHFVSQGLTSCWGDVPLKNNYTTYNARTYLQPQLNKACKKEEKREKGDVNPKDFILFSKSDYQVVRTWKDNTGERIYKDDMAFPTLKFPSDHGILTTIIEPKPAEE